LDAPERWSLGLLAGPPDASITALLSAWLVAFLAATCHCALRLYSSRRLLDSVSGNRRGRFEKILEKEERLEATTLLVWLAAEFWTVLHLASLLPADPEGFFGTGPRRLVLSAAVVLLALLPTVHAFPRLIVGRGHGEAILRSSLRLLHFLSIVLIPLVQPLLLLPAGRRLFDEEGKPNDIEKDLATEEIIDAVEEGERSGALEEREAHMIERVLSIQDLSVSEVMTPRTDLTSISMNASLEEACTLAHEEGHSKIPVYEKNRDEIAGIFHLRDAIPLLTNGSESPALKEVLREAYFVPETKKVTQLLREFQSNEQSIAIVLDEYGGTAGLITIEDIIEEIVGDIREEHDQEESMPIQRLGSNVVSLDPRLRIEEVNEGLEFKLPESEEYDTLGGFVFSHLDRIPETDEVFSYQNLEFRVLRVENRRIARLQVRTLEPQ